MPESLEEIATCALYEPTAQREAVLAREIIALRERVQILDELNDRGESWEVVTEKRLDALESAGARGEDIDRKMTADEWRGRAEHAEREVGNWRRSQGTTHAQYLAVKAERDALQQQLAESRAALAKYGRHTATCSFNSTLPAICTCGLAAALAATTPTAGGS